MIGDKIDTRRRRRSSVASLLAVIALGLGCGGFPKETVADWTVVQPGSYSFEDRDLALIFDHSRRGLFMWRFKNKRGDELIIDHREITLRKRDVPGTYTLWGKPKRETIPYPRIQLPYDKFINLTFPIQYNSPIYPVKAGEVLSLVFLARWGTKTRQYTVAIPEPPAEDPDGP